MKTETLSEKELSKKYLESGGNYCPFCDSKFIEAGQSEADGNMIFQDVSCPDCEKRWVDQYTLTGFQEQ